MKPVGIYDIIRIDEFSSTPKYQQLINAVLKGIEHGRLKQQDVLPSINDLTNWMFPEIRMKKVTGISKKSGYWVPFREKVILLKVLPWNKRIMYACSLIN